MEHLRLQDAVIFLAIAGVIIPMMKAMRLNAVVGFLFCGVLLGPDALASLADQWPWLRHILITDVAGVRALAELGIVFLLFMIGLELSFDRLTALKRWVLGLGSLQVLTTALAIGAVAVAFGLPLPAATLVGLCLALSSTALIVQLLTDQGRFGTTVGRSTFAVLLAQDLAVVPILFLLGVFADESATLVSSLAIAVLAALVTVALIILIGRRLVRPFFRLVGSTQGPEFFLAATLLLILVTASLTEMGGLSAALGAFLVGLLVAETEFRHEIEVSIEPFKGLLIGLFFISVGMSLDVLALLQAPLAIAAAVAALIFIKSLIAYTLARLFRLTHAEALESALLLSQAGEFGFAVVTVAATRSLLSPEIAAFVLLVITLSLLLTPAIARFARFSGARLDTAAAQPGRENLAVAEDLRDHVIIVGYGRVGRLLADVLDRQQIPHVALDLDVDRVAQCRARGAPVFLGDASRTALLHKVGLTHALALAVTMDDPDAAEHVVHTAREANANLPVLARARDQQHAQRLAAAGATIVVPEVVEAGLQLAHQLLDQAGFPADASRDLIELHRMSANRAYGFDLEKR